MARLSLVRFNLAIEMLFISGDGYPTDGAQAVMFQSRNREAFHFRSVPAEPLTRLG